MYYYCIINAVLLYLSYIVLGRQRSSIDDAPSIHTSHQVQFFLLQGAFPYNTPEDIRETMGYAFSTYDTPHAGLGVWDVTEGLKYSIEFVSKDYVGGLLPDTTGGVITWKNDAEVVISDPLDKSVWDNSELITTTTGTAYKQLIDYLHDHKSKWQKYQPVSAAFLNSSVLSFYLSEGDRISTKRITKLGISKVPTVNSYWFLNKMIEQLVDYGCDVDLFLHGTGTAFLYTVKDDVDPSNVPVISWVNSATESDPVYREVVAWYSDLSNCYGLAYNLTKKSNQDASFFFGALEVCYGGYAYVFKSDTSVYNVTLGNISSGYSTPLLGAYEYTVPDSDNDDYQSVTVMDVVFIIVLALFFVVLIVIICTKLFGKRKRRRVSFEGERIAMRTVEIITTEPLETTEKNYDINSIDDRASLASTFRSYYHGSRQSMKTLEAVAQDHDAERHSFKENRSSFRSLTSWMTSSSKSKAHSDADNRNNDYSSDVRSGFSKQEIQNRFGSVEERSQLEKPLVTECTIMEVHSNSEQGSSGQYRAPSVP